MHHRPCLSVVLLLGMVHCGPREALDPALEAAHWARFQEVVRALATETGTEALLEAHPHLVGENRRRAFLEQVRAWRPRLQRLGSNPDQVQVRRRLRRSRDGKVEVLRCQVDYADHARLDVLWREGRLSGISLGIH